MVRESIRSMPAFTQPFWTWLTAKPLAEELHAEQTRTPFFHVWTSAATIVAGIALASYGYLVLQNALIILLGFVVTSGGIKKMQVMICHNCAHNMIFQDRDRNTRLGTFISCLFMLKPFEIYKKEHLLHHDHKTLLTDDDDTLSFLQEVVGLRPADSIPMMWLKLIWRAVSPVVILRSVLRRIKGMATAPNRTAGVICLVFWLLFSVLATYLDLLGVFLLAWVAPVFAGFHISSTFRLAAEHTWPSVDVLQRRGIEFISESTTGVFIGEELKLPETAGRILGVVHRTMVAGIWVFKMLTFHLLVRVFIMVGDTPCHDFHHRRPKSRDWPNYITAREHDKVSGSKPYTSNYEDYWGYITSVTRNFKNFQNARPYYDNLLAA